MALLEQIIKTSSRENDIIFDPFYDCGTALVASDPAKSSISSQPEIQYAISEESATQE